MNWKLALAGLYLASPGTSLFASAQGCPPKPIPIRDIKFFDIDGDNLHNYELRGYAHIKDDAPGGIPRALRIDQLSSYALLKGVDISPSNMQDVTLAIGFYIESIRPAPADAPVPGQVDSYGWIMSHDNGGFDRAIFLHDERFGGAGMSVGYIPDAEPPQVPLQEWIQVVAVWRQGGECSLYIDNEKVDFPEAVIGKNGPGLPDVAIGAPQLRTYHKSNDNDFWIKDVKIFDYALSDQEVDDLNCNFVETLEPTLDCGQGGDLVYSCTECVAGDGSASGCAGDCMWRPEIPHCVEKNDSTDNIVDSIVSCGDHDVADCSHCDVNEDGTSGCDGECTFIEGSCRPNTCKTEAGLTVSYFAFGGTSLPSAGLLNTYTPYKTMNEPKIDWYAGHGYVANSGRKDNVAIAYEGSLLFDQVGRYNVCLDHDNGAKMFVDGQRKINNGGLVYGKNCFNIDITIASRVKKILVEYFEQTQNAFLKLDWLKPDGRREIIPPSAWVDESCDPSMELPTCTAGAGLTVSYFAFGGTSLPSAGLLNTYTPYKTMNEPKIDFYAAGGNVANSGRKDYVAITYEGFMLFDVIGQHRICLDHDNGARMFVDGVRYINNGGLIYGEDCFNLNITNETRVRKILVEYFEQTQNAFLRFKWRKPGHGLEYVPESAFVQEYCRPED